MHGLPDNFVLTPPWLRLKLLQCLPEPWRELVYEYIGLLDQLFRDQPPTVGVLQARVDEGRLLLRFRCRPSPNASQRLVFRGIGSRLTELSRHQLNQLAQLKTKQLPDFDIDDYIEDRIERALRPRNVTVFEWSSDEQLEQSAAARDGDHARRVAQTVKRLRSTGPTRPLVKPDDDWPAKLEQLQRESPNFTAVLQAIVKPHLALCALGIRHRMPPILLAGPPGVGKTRFAHALARLLAVPQPLFISLAEETNGAALGGSSTFWSNSSPGKLFEVLAWGSQGRPAVANPLVLLDEIDKRGNSHFDPLGPMYGLLEADTSRSFTDQSVPDVSIDASNVRIVATANDVSLLPEPLLSRLAVFLIEPPTQAQMADIVKSIHLQLITEMQIAVSCLLPEELVQKALRLSPRIIRGRLETCIGHALLAGRTEVQIEDWHAAGQGLDAPQRRQIGFVR
jgi:hypothetical protein